MRCTAAFMTAALAFATLSATNAARAESDAEIEQVVRRHVQPMLIAAGGMAFIATLLAQAVKQGEVSLDDPVAKYVTELQQGEIRKVTLGQLASHTSGLTRTPQQDEPTHRGPYALADFIRYLNAWQADEAHAPGKQDIYSNTGFVLLSLALQRRFNTPSAQLMETRLLAPLGMTSTALPVPRANARGQLAPE